MTDDAPKLGARLATITPAIATRLLQRNTHNRTPRESLVDQYAQDIRRGAWVVNGESIKVSVTGRILDGQHRLMAVERAGRAIETFLVSGLPDEAQDSMDQGRARSFSDVVKLAGEKNCTNLAGAVRIVCLYGLYGVPIQPFRRPVPTIGQLQTTLDRNPGIRESVTLAMPLRRPWLPATLVGALHYLFDQAAELDDDAADGAAAEFFQDVARREAAPEGDPVGTLRRRLIQAHADGENLNLRVRLAFVVMAWNAWLSGEQLTELRWKPGNSAPDAFPAIAGLVDPREPA